MSCDIKIVVCYFDDTLKVEGNNLLYLQLGVTNAKKKIEWMDCYDNEGENISNLNYFFCELTGIFWIWKNYDKIGNPDNIGFEHYRRIFDLNFNDLKFDIIAPTYDSSQTNLQQFENAHKTKDLHNIGYLLKDTNPEYLELWNEYLQQKKGYFFNMFIMKKDLFFEYCNFIFPILFKFHDKTDYASYSYYNQRMPGFIAERLTGFFIFMKKNENKIIIDTKIKLLPIVKNFNYENLINESTNKFNVITCCNDDYIPSFAAMLVSLLSNNENTAITLWVLYISISDSNKKIIHSLVSKYNKAELYFFKRLRAYVWVDEASKPTL